MPALPVFLDNHSTTRVDPRVLDAMLPYFTEKYGNASSINHAFGWEAADAVALARESIGKLVGAPDKSVVFTSGATEANNLAIKGVLHSAGSGGHLITTAAEHRSVLDPASRLSRQGFEVTTLAVDEHGMVSPSDVADAIQPHTRLVSVIWANNEVGSINPIGEIAAICRERSVLLHTDAVQAAGRIPIDFTATGIDLMSITAHKLYGPKGVGALIVRRSAPRIQLEPLLDGGGHERGLRSGTLPVPLIVGFGKACELAEQEMPGEANRIGELRDELWEGLREQLDGLVLNGHPEQRLPGNLNVSFENVDGEALMTSVKDIAVSSGSACTSSDPEPSHVLRAMGRSDSLTRSSLRFGLGRFTTRDEIEFAVEHVMAAVRRLRKLAAGRT